MCVIFIVDPSYVTIVYSLVVGNHNLAVHAWFALVRASVCVVSCGQTLYSHRVLSIRNDKHSIFVWALIISNR